VVVDRDILELHNLQRQTLFDEQDVRERLPKAIAAERRLRAINSTIQIDACPADVTATNVEELTAPADLVLDGTDNFETRYLLNDAMVKAGKPWVYGGVLGTEGTIMAIRPGQGPCLRCVFPEPPDGRALPTCETQGVLNTAVAWVAAQQVTLALKILVGRPLEVARLHAIDVWQCSVTSVTATTAPDCVCCGQRRFEFLDAERGATSTILCGRNSVQVTPERPSPVDLESLRRRLEGHGEVSVNGLLLELAMGERRLVMFPDGRVLVMGTTDASEARSLVARYLGA
jgi:adenylyltransferase/sulfurtransferase